MTAGDHGVGSKTSDQATSGSVLDVVAELAELATHLPEHLPEYAAQTEKIIQSNREVGALSLAYAALVTHAFR